MEFTVAAGTGEANSTVLTRSEVPTLLFGSGSEVKEVGLGPQGRYLLAGRQTSPETLRHAIRRRVEARSLGLLRSLRGAGDHELQRPWSLTSWRGTLVFHRLLSRACEQAGTPL